MTRTRSTMVLNRPVFTQHRFSSSSLTVLGTLLHRFTEPGRYQVSVAGADVSRTDSLTVSQAGAHQQVNIDMAKDGIAPAAVDRTGATGGCCCEPAAGRDLAIGGVVAFYASAGTGAYQVTVTHLGERKKRVDLDNAKTVPRGDYFAVTLVRPGTYRAVDELSGASAEVHVSIPDREKIDTQRVELLRLSEDRLEPGALRLHAGQSVLVECSQDARLVFELRDPDTSSVVTRSGKHRFTRPRQRS